MEALDYARMPLAPPWAGAFWLAGLRRITQVRQHANKASLPYVASRGFSGRYASPRDFTKLL